MTANTKYDNQ